MNQPRVLVIGAGISGLATAWWLGQQGIDTEVWEAEPQPGGKIRTTSEQGFVTERAAGMLVNFRPEVDQLVARSRLEGRRCMRAPAPYRYAVHHGRLARIPMTLPGMVRSPVWSPSAKLRMFSEFLVRRGGYEGESVSRFITRRLGPEILDTAIDPFVSGTLASDPELAEARSVLPALTTLERRYGSLTLGMLINSLLKRRTANKADSFSFQTGMSELIRQLAAGGSMALRCGIRVSEIQREGSQWLVSGHTGASRRCLRVEQLVISTPAYVTGSLLAPLHEELASLLNGIKYNPVGVVHLGFPEKAIAHPLDGTGFLVSRNNDLAINGNLWMSRLFPGRAPQGHALLTSYLGGARHPEQLQQSDQQLLQTTLEGLSPLLGIKGDPVYLKIDRHPRALPLYYGQYHGRMERIGVYLKMLPGLHLNANYLGGVSVRERIFQGKQQAERIAQAMEPDLEPLPPAQSLATAKHEGASD